jgi:DNA-directed RNA polymerase subunit H
MAKKKIPNISVQKHVLVPKHTKASEAEKKRVLKAHNIDVTQLPRIKLSDPALRGMDVKEGDVIKIERPSYTAGVSIYYRGVTNE